MGAIDADAHVVENIETFRYIDEADAHLAPTVVVQQSGADVAGEAGNVQKEFWVIDGRVQPKEGNIGFDTPEDSRNMTDIDARLAHMDELEIDVQVLYPTVFLRAWTQNRACEAVICESYNRWLADIWKRSPERLRWVVMPALRSMDTIRDQLEFAKDNGACGIFIRGLECEMRTTNPYFFPLFELAGELDMPICYHSGNNSFQVRDIYKDECGFGRSKLPVISAFHNLLMDGIPGQFPKVRWGFVEVSAQWIPYVLNDLEIRFKRKDRPFFNNALADNNIWVACQVTDDLGYIVDCVGDDHLVVGTDYGHSDTSSEIKALRLIKEDGKIPPASVDKILNANARALYGLN